MQLGIDGSWVTVGILCVGALAGGVWFWLRHEPTPEELERARRVDVSRNGRMTDAVLTDAQGSMLYYTYSARGMTYLASQDISALRASLPDDLMHVVGPAAVKYMTQNPANSIVVCEEWSGIRKMREGIGT
jgi:hypothetical protein